VAIMRGPRSPGPVVSYGMKCYYAQQAGAAAVVFVDWDPNGYRASGPKPETSNPEPFSAPQLIRLFDPNLQDMSLSLTDPEPKTLNPKPYTPICSAFTFIPRIDGP
jgi:hypothetical protein